MKIFGFAGFSGSGKTTLIEQLIPLFVARGLRVSLVKHAHHSFDIDQPGKDSHRHRMAGAAEVMVASAKRWALIHEHGDAPEPNLDALVARMSPVDLVLVEGDPNKVKSEVPDLPGHWVLWTQVDDPLDGWAGDAKARLDALYVCTHHPSEGEPPFRMRCEGRKPKPGLLTRAAGELDLDRDLVGGHLEDLPQHRAEDDAHLVGARQKDVRAPSRIGQSVHAREVVVVSDAHAAEVDALAVRDRGLGMFDFAVEDVRH